MLHKKGPDWGLFFRPELSFLLLRESEQGG